jgi:CO/xanthine dehydrogenase FAD-binding subunit
MRVGTIAEAVAELPDRVISAGGTLIKPAIAKGGAPGRFVDVSRLKTLATITREGDELVIGALVANETLIDHPDVIATVPALAHAASSIGNPHVRRAGTIGGNVACRLARTNLPPVLLALDARVRIRQGTGTPEDHDLAAILRGGVPGGGLITAIVIPLGGAVRAGHVGFDKLAWRDATAQAIVTCAIAVVARGGIVTFARLIAGGLCVPVRLPRAEQRLAGNPLDAQTIEAVAAIASAEPPFEVSDVPAGEPYRRRLVGRTIARLLSEVPRG